MASNAETLIEQGRQALNDGNKAQAQDYLLQATELDQSNVEAWMWLAAAVESTEEKRICLENVLTLDPNNANAQRLLEELDRPGATDSTVDDAFADTFGADPAPEAPPAEADLFSDTFGGSSFMDDDTGDSFSAGGPFSTTDFSAPEETIAPEYEDDAEEAPEETLPPEAEVPYEDVAEESYDEDYAEDEDYVEDEEYGGYYDDEDYVGDEEDADYYDDGEPDYLTLLPENIKPTRLPGTDEQVSGGLVAGVVIVSLLNVAAIAVLVLQLLA